MALQRKVDQLERENQVLRGEVAFIKEEIARLGAVITSLLALQTQTSASRTTSSAVPFASTPLLSLTEGYPGCMLRQDTSEDLGLDVQASYVQQTMPLLPPGLSLPQTTMPFTTPSVGTMTQGQEPVFHARDTDGLDRVGHLQGKYDKMQKEVRSLRRSTMRLEEGVPEGRLTKGKAPMNEEPDNDSQNRKKARVGTVSYGRSQTHHPLHSHFTTPTYTPQPQFHQRQQTRPPTSQQKSGRPKGTPQFDPIPMRYTDLLPALLSQNLVQLRSPPPIPEIKPTWYRSDLTCAFHQGAPGHDTEQCCALKKQVQNLTRANLLSFRETNPNIQTNPLPNHGSSMNMAQAEQLYEMQ